MSDIFISYVEEDKEVAWELALGLEEKGYSTWCYHFDTAFGPKYPGQIVKAIDACSGFILLISPHSLGSQQVERELAQAFQGKKPLIPILHDITDETYKKRNSDWNFMLGTATSCPIPPTGIASIIDRIFQGLDTFGIHPDQIPDAQKINKIRAALGKTAPSESSESLALPKPPEKIEQKPPTDTHDKEQQRRRRRKILIAVGIVLALVVVSAITIVAVRGGFGGNPITSPTPTPTYTTNTSADVTIIKQFNISIEDINGIAYVGTTNLWVVTNGGDMFKINNHGDVLKTCRTPGVTPEGLAWDGTSLWVFTTNYGFIYNFRINESDPKPESETISSFK